MAAPALLLATLIALSPATALAQRQQGRTDSSRAATAREELLALETRWNDAHIYADTATLYRLWADDIIVIVPDMRPFTKDDLKAFWRSGRSNITRHETSDVTVRGYDNTAVVEGRLRRQQSFSGQVESSEWRFTKIYVKRNGRWQVVSYHASPLPAGS
ncbi:MAG TPA: nuclear transport factor 2 family protein [Gemmatimonadaceae bacterium]|nr:nuclear transport factor 2 family protein [Gemmatimonadaceae bacterium]